MIEVIEPGSNELQRFFDMERDADVAPNILPYSVEQHVEEFNRSDICVKPGYSRFDQRDCQGQTFLC